MNRPVITVPLVDRYDLSVLEDALDALEVLHDYEADQFNSERIRVCLCGEASTWRQARKILKQYRELLGLSPRLIWEV